MVAIIAALVTLLLPVVSSARERARSVVCQANLRQLAAAFIAYTADNNGYFPKSASSISNAPPSSDWLWWRPGRGLGQSPIARYYGRGFDGAALRCPSDEWDRRSPGLIAPALGPYRFSYSLSVAIAREGTQPNIKITSIKNPCEVILAVDEENPDDGSWRPTGGPYSMVPDYLAKRHRVKGTRADTPGWVSEEEWGERDIDNPDSMGNVAYVGGNVGMMTRREAHGWMWMPFRPMHW